MRDLQAHKGLTQEQVGDVFNDIYGEHYSKASISSATLSAMYASGTSVRWRRISSRCSGPVTGTTPSRRPERSGSHSATNVAVITGQSSAGVTTAPTSCTSHT